MKSENKKIILSGVLFFLILSMVVSPLDAKRDHVYNKQGSIFIESDNFILKLHAGKPDLMIWQQNETTTGRQSRIPVFRVAFTHIVEVFSDNLTIGNRSDLGGKVYNLASALISWTLTTSESDKEINATLTSDPFDNGAIIKFIFHLYFEDVTITQTLNDTTYTHNIKALSEIKFDIIVENWLFTEGATGLAFLVKVHEMAYRHQVRVGERVNIPEEEKSRENMPHSTNRTADPKNHGIKFGDSKTSYSYFAWTPQADIFDSEGNYLETVDVVASSTSFNHEGDNSKGRKFGKEYINVILAYPNYGNERTLIHDPVIGIDETPSGISYSSISLLALPITVILFTILVRRQRK